MARDDWRIRIELPEEQHAHGLLGRLGALGDETARRLEEELEGRRLAVTRDDSTVFVYVASSLEAESAQRVVQAELAESGIEATLLRIEHWLDSEDRWDDEPPGETWEQDELDRGFAPWEVRIDKGTRGAAEELAKQLEADGLSVVRSFSYVIVGASSEAEARELAKRIGGEVEGGGEVVWETARGNPFAIFGGLGGDAAPL
jgi:hypothetical protein